MDRTVEIAIGDRRTSKRYKNTEVLWSALLDRCKTPIRTTETVEEYRKMPKAKQDAAKDCGGFDDDPVKGTILDKNAALEHLMRWRDVSIGNV